MDLEIEWLPLEHRRRNFPLKGFWPWGCRTDRVDNEHVEMCSHTCMRGQILTLVCGL